MPLLLNTNELQPGMKLALPVKINGRVMLQAEKPLTSTEIDALRTRYVDLNVRVLDPLLDTLIEFEDDTHERMVGRQIRLRVSEAMSEVAGRFEHRAALTGDDIIALETATHELLEFLRDNPVTAAVVTECLDADRPLSTHTGNVFYLSMLLATAAREHVVAERQRAIAGGDLPIERAGDFAPLGLATMVMDIGLLPLAETFRRGYIQNEDELQQIRTHPEVGAAQLPEGVSAVARSVCRTHHENQAGEGYPAQVGPDRLHVFARIVRIADAFSAATSDSFGAPARSPVRAVWEMSAGPYRRYFDETLMGYFARLIQPFPIGARIRLRDGRYAVVVKYNHQDPFRPVVIVAYDVQGARIPTDQLEPPLLLADHAELRLGSYEGEELSFLYATMIDDAPVKDRFTTVLDALYP